MQTITRNTLKLALVLMLVVAMFGSGFNSSVAYAAPSCASTGSISLDLWAKTGTATLYGSTNVTIWGYTTGLTGATDSPTLPGPVLTVDQGQDVTVNFTNTLGEASAVSFPGQEMIPDTAGATAGGGMKSYSFRACKPGTFLYEAGLIPGSQHQLAMGLYGALVVRPTGAPLQAYGDPSTAFDVQNVVVLSEFDTALYTSPNTPATFDMRKFAPKYFLINGKAYPGTATIPATSGQNVLLRYVNAGLQSHAMSLLGYSQTVIATDGNAFTYPHKMISETIAPGQTLDAIIPLPASVPDGSKFALYDANMLLRNSTSVGANAGLGGMLTFLNVSASAGGPGGDPGGPVTSGVSLSPNPTNGSTVTVDALVSDVVPVISNILAAEFYIDNSAGTPNAMTASDLAFDSTSESVTGTIPAGTLAGLTPGNHTIYVRGKDADNTWGDFATAVLSLDNGGPLLSSLTLTPNPSNGTVPVALAFTANDTATGGNNVTAAEYWIDGSASHTPISIGSPAVVISLNASIPSGLLAGTHVVSVRAQDSMGNWSTTANINLLVDNAGPATSALALVPNPSNGAVNTYLSFNANDSATGNNNITAAEYWIDSGAPVAVTVSLPAPVKTLSATILPGLSVGTHVLHARSQDSVGNWGPEAPTINLVIDNVGPSTSGVKASPNPNNGSMPLSTSVQAVRVSASFSDSASGNANISTAEGFIDAPGTIGTGFAFVANDGIFNLPSEGGFADIPLVVVAALTPGNHALCIHAKDAPGNWGAFDCTYSLKITPIVKSITRITANPTKAASVQFLVTFSTSVNGGALGNFGLTTTGVSGASVASVSGSGATRTVTVNTGTGSGTLRLNLTSPTGIVDSANPANAMLSNGLPFAGPTYTIDKSVPTFSSLSVNPTSIIQGTVTSITLTANGAADTGGSGLTGGEYWVNPPTSSTPAQGSGTQFSGTTTNVNVSAFAAGSFTFSARMRDAAGNWSTIRTATFTVVPDAIFSNGFDTGGSPWGWSSVSTGTTSRLNVSAAAAMLGSLRGLQAQGNNTNFVQYNFTPVTGAYDARFYFNPNGNTGTNQDILVARTSGGTTVFRVRYRWNGGTPQVQIQVGTGTGNIAWTNITNGASNRIEVVWQSNGTLQLFVGGSLVADQSLTATNNSIGQVRMGSVTNGGSATLEYFDAFSSKRTITPYGP